MTDDALKKVAHVWVSNTAFTRLTGIKKVCLFCGTNDPKMKCEPRKR